MISGRVVANRLKLISAEEGLESAFNSRSKGPETVGIIPSAPSGLEHDYNFETNSQFKNDRNKSLWNSLIHGYIDILSIKENSPIHLLLNVAKP